MKIAPLTKVIYCIFLCVLLLVNTSNAQISNDYTLAIEGYNWEPAVSKVILVLDAPITN
jgi:hypothetical protein